MGKLVLYGLEMCPPVRSVMLVLKELGLEYEFKEVNPLVGDHLKEEFLKMNPQHTVPALVDDGFAIWDSHAIATYLIGKYAKEDTLYPKDLQRRALVDQRLHFDSGILFPHLQAICAPIVYKDNPYVPAEKMQAVTDAYSHLERFLEKDPYLVGDKMTVVDLCCVASVASLHALLSIDPEKTPKLQAWLDRMAQLPYYEDVNGKGARAVGRFIKGKIKELLSKREHKPSETLPLD